MNMKKKEIDVNIKIRGVVTKTATPTQVTKSAVVTPDIVITVPNAEDDKPWITNPNKVAPSVKADTPW